LKKTSQENAPPLLKGETKLAVEEPKLILPGSLYVINPVCGSVNIFSGIQIRGSVMLNYGWDHGRPINYGFVSGSGSYPDTFVVIKKYDVRHR
jgi:hypothetical protein